MSEDHPSPFPTALVLDTSFLRTIGGTDSSAYQTFINYVQTEERELYLTSGVVEELDEQRGYISIDWPDRANTTEWITILGDIQPGVRIMTGHERVKSWIEHRSDWRHSSRHPPTNYGRPMRNCQPGP